MEIKVNKEIRDFEESFFFGLGIRQCIFSLLACIIAVILYFALRSRFGIETLSWVCILGAFPFAILGFASYNGMPAEKFIVAWLKNEMIPKRLIRKRNTPLKKNTVIKDEPIIKPVVKKQTTIKKESEYDLWFDEILEDIQK